ncbi:hypothetical protein RKD05_002153 [Microbacterium sp. SLBN-111]
MVNSPHGGDRGLCALLGPGTEVNGPHIIRGDRALGISWLWRRRGAVASGATLTAAAVTISTLAALHPGIPTADLELDDGGVWVTKTSDLLVGHLNYPSRLLDGALRTRAADFDILQDGDTVGVVDAVNSTLTLVDPASVALGNDATLPEKSVVALGGTTFAVLAAGHVYTVPSTSLTGTTFDPDAAAADIGDGGAVAVSRSGAHIVAASARDAALLTIDSGTGEARSQALPKLADDAALATTAVGEQGVALDTASGTLYTPGGTAVELPDGAGARLQEAGADADSVYVATPTALLREPLGGGTPETVATVAKGVPSAPVVVGGCAYAVWSGTGAYVRDCPGTADDVQLTIETTPDAHLVLRANRRVVVVNDTVAGTVWAVEQNALRIENWDEVVPPASDDAQEEQSQDEKPQFDLPERSAQNTPPTAVDDQYGVRAGRTTILRVTENDTDPDGDLLSASLVNDPPSGWDVQPVLGGAALQASVPANASGATALRYRVDDGRGGTAEATATVTVRPPDVNEPPVQKRIDTVLVEAGASLTYGVLDAWSDPDGDDVFLQSATVDGGDQVTFRSNGVLEYTAATAQTGIHEVTLVVSDGRETTEGVLRVDVRPTDTLNPVANADRVTAVAGVPVTVAPLDNDLSPTGRQLRLSKHDTVPGATITPDFTAGTFDFVAEQPGTYYVQYLVTDGPHSAVGIVRIDVVAAGASPLPPVAVRDLALLPTGRSTLVDVLANDVDPAGGILVVQTAHVPPTAGVSVEVLENRILRVTDLSGLSGPVTLTYTVSNGTQSATGEVLVMPVPLPAQLRPPVTVDDTAVVRVGDVVSSPVLANDYSPDNDTLRLEPTFVETDAPDKNAIFVDGDRIRFQAGAEPGTVHATYEVSDSQQNRTAGYLTIQVLPADQGSNSAPRPKPVTARVIAGNTVRIAIPLTGIDTDGDSVELVGVASNPQKGTVTTGDSWFVYEAYPDATGRDTFTYTVRDRLGAEAQSTVVVGVAAPGYDNQAPYAVKDTVTVKPGRRVAVPVTANDSDPDGDPISIDPNGLTAPEGVDAEILGGRVVVTAPETPGQYTFSYTIADSYGATAVGALLVTVDPNAPAVAPIARDDRVPPGQITSAPTVDVNVLENDEDPDGTVDDLRVTTSDSTVTVGTGGVLTVTLQPTPQIIRYRIEDADSQSAQAFVFVPGLDALVPTLATTEPVTVTSGETVRITLADQVHVRPGREPRIATADSVRAGHADGSPMIVDEHTLEYRSAAGFFGRDSLGVLVTDGTGPDDPQGLSGYVSIPITVVPAENQSPIMRNASVQVAPGEGSQKLDLGRLTRDPDEGDEEKLTFSIDGDVPAGFRASISGRTLEVSADADVAAGATGTVRVLASDGTSAPGAGLDRPQCRRVAAPVPRRQRRRDRAGRPGPHDERRRARERHQPVRRQGTARADLGARRQRTGHGGRERRPRRRDARVGLRRHHGRELPDRGCHEVGGAPGRRPDPAHGAGPPGSARHPHGHVDPGPHRGAVVVDAHQQRVGDHRVQGELPAGVQQDLCVDDLHARRAHERRRIHVHGHRHQRGRGFRSVARVGTRAPGRPPRHPGLPDDRVRRPESHGHVGRSALDRVAGDVVQPRDLAGPGDRPDPAHRRRRNEHRVGRSAERRRLPGARAGGEPRAGPERMEPVLGGSRPRGRAERAGHTDDDTGDSGRGAGADRCVVGRTRRRERRPRIGLHAHGEARWDHRQHDRHDRDRPERRRGHQRDGLRILGDRAEQGRRLGGECRFGAPTGRGRARGTGERGVDSARPVGRCRDHARSAERFAVQ